MKTEKCTCAFVGFDIVCNCLMHGMDRLKLINSQEADYMCLQEYEGNLHGNNAGIWFNKM
jgi:hypothetical protein